jgi:hypothetical protein
MSTRKTKTPVELATDFVTDSIETAKSAFGGEASPGAQGFEAMNKAASAVQARFAEMQMKGVEMAEANAKSVFAFWRDALAVKSPEAFLSLQQNYMKSQAETMMRQAQDLNAMGAALVREVSAPMQDNISKTFAAFQPKQAA